MNLLLIEDDPRIARVVVRALTDDGHRVDTVSDGLGGFLRAERCEHDVVLLDVMLPEMSGLEVARELRRQRVRTPILMLTARDAVYDRVCGLDSGADDYLTKPFALEELLARVRALGRRKSEKSSSVLRVGDLLLDVERRTSSRAERPLDLTTREFDVLAYLMRNAGRVLGKDVILARVWGDDSDAGANAVELYVHHLRQKVDRGFARPLIRTVRGVGYTIRP
jgi:DNA-binding response OmpR family regulator